MPEIFDADKNSSKESKGAVPDDKQEKAAKEETHTIFEIEQEDEPSPPKQAHKKKRFENGVDEYSETLRKEKPSRNPLRAYAPKPYNTGFDSQMLDEEVVLVLRRHPVTQLKKLFIILLSFFVPFLLFASPMLDFLTPSLKFAVVVGWYSLLLSFILESFLVWFFNVFIVTDERIIDVDFMSLIYKNISSAKIESIEDITAATGGFLGSMVDFGTVYIQTAGETPQLEFEDVPHPARISKILNELILEEEREKLEGRVR